MAAAAAKAALCIKNRWMLRCFFYDDLVGVNVIFFWCDANHSISEPFKRLFSWNYYISNYIFRAAIDFDNYYYFAKWNRTDEGTLSWISNLFLFLSRIQIRLEPSTTYWRVWAFSSSFWCILWRTNTNKNFRYQKIIYKYANNDANLVSVRTVKIK